MDDAHTLDPSIEAFIEAQELERYKIEAPSTSTSMHAAPMWVDADDLGDVSGGVLRLYFPHNHRHVMFMRYPLARDLAAAINAVLMRHADAERPAHEKVRDIVVAAVDREAF